MYENQLINAGLTKEQAEIYGILLAQGSIPAREVNRKTKFTRPLTYKILDELVGLKLVSKKKGANNVYVFAPEHPGNLEKLTQDNLKDAEAAARAATAVLDGLVSGFNLVSGMPGVSFFEGDKGTRQVVKDSLEAKGEILQYHDPDSIGKFIAEANALYMRERIMSKIKKRMLIPKRTSKTYVENYKQRSERYRLLTKVKFFDVDSTASTLTMIYGDKVSYLTLEPKTRIGVIIQSKSISDFHRALFEQNWKKASHIE